MWKNQIQELNNMSSNRKCVINIAWRYKTIKCIIIAIKILNNLILNNYWHKNLNWLIGILLIFLNMTNIQ